MNKVTGDKVLLCIIIFIFVFLSLVNFHKSGADIINKLETINKENATTVIDEIQEQYRTNFFKKNEFISVYGITLNLMNKKMVGNFEFVKDKNNLIHQFSENKNQQDLDNFSSDVIELKNMAEEKGIPLTYVQIPTRIFKNDISGLKIQTEQAENDDMDRIIKTLTENKVDVIDFREVIENEYEKSNVFLNTDGHMRTETEFYTMNYLVKYLNQKYGMQFDLNSEALNLNNYNIIQKDFIGNFDLSSGKYFVGSDNFKMYIPKFETNFSLTDYTTGDIKNGSFEDVIMNDYQKDENSNEYTYWITNYLRYSTPYYSITNNKKDNNNILVIMDSNGLGIMSYLSLLSNNITIVDTRFQENSDYVGTAINSRDYDAVLVIEHLTLVGYRFFGNIFNNPTAQIISTDMPTEMERGKSYDVNITVKNTSNQIWSETDMVRLCIWQDGQDFGYRVNIPDGVEIKPNEEYTFTLCGFVAPPSDSTYVEFQMLQEGIAYFGDKYRVDVKIKE